MITQEIFDNNLDGILRSVEVEPDFVAVAVSGGSDSLSLSLLANNWAEKRGVRIVALTVDHRLREESADEAKWVHEVLTKHGMEHEILTYTGELPVSNVEAEARKYRYDMLFDYANKNGVDCLFIAHNQDEQRETFFLNLARGSGLYGLCGMPSIVDRDGVYVVRPMLGFTKDEIKEYLESLEQKWVEDPSNQDTKYARVRIRNLKTFIDELGLTSDRLAKTISSLERARDAIEFFVDECVKKNLSMMGHDFILDRYGLLLYPDEVCLRVLAKVIKSISGKDYPPRFDSLERVFDSIKNGTLGGGQTLAGLKVYADRKGDIIFTEEVRRKTKPKKKKDFKKFGI